jgi:uncharacterized iron-regulated membrane protein
MKATFRQSMDWLHTWTGLVVGWVLFFVFLTGTLGYVNAEIDRWMRPELPLSPAQPSAAVLLRLGEQRLRTMAPDAEFWQITFARSRIETGLSVGWRGRQTGKGNDAFTQEILDTHSGLPAQGTARETGGGTALYTMHYDLHYLPVLWAYRIVGVCSMFMLVAILTGIVTHKKIFKNFFTFRPVKGQTSWLDGHTLLGVSALPFHLMITWSGLIFLLFTYMPVAVDVLYPQGKARDRFEAQGYGNVELNAMFDVRLEKRRHELRPPATLVPLTRLLSEVEQRWGAGAVSFIDIDNPGRENAIITFYGRQGGSVLRLRSHTLRFDGVTGQMLGENINLQSATARFYHLMLGLHEGYFAGPFLRVLYVLAGMVSTVMIGTGLLLWSAKRKAQLANNGRPSLGVAAIDILNLGTMIGLPIAIAAYLWANRLLPLGMKGRGEWEVNSMFIVWSLTFLHAIWRPIGRAWIELCWLAAGAYGLLPILNALTTNRHLGVTIPAGDWVLAGVDLSAFGTGLFFVFLARSLYRKHLAKSIPCNAENENIAMPLPT